MWRRRAEGGGGGLNFDFSTGVLDPRITVTRAGATATYFDNTGTLQIAPANTPRFDYDPITKLFKGWLIEEARTNSIRNSTMQGAVVGVPGTMPTNWSMINTGGGTISVDVVAIGTEAGFPYIDLRFHAASVIASSAIRLAFEVNNGIPASQNQQYAFSLSTKIVAGDLTNISPNTLKFGYLAFDNTNSPLAGAEFGNINTTTNVLTRYSYVPPVLPGATTAYIKPTIAAVGGASGGAVDFTLRIGLPQCELGAFATSPIPTSGSAQTRNLETASMLTAGWYNPNDGTISAEIISEGVQASGAQVIAQIDDGTLQNRSLMYINPTSGFLGQGIVGGSTVTNATSPVLRVVGAIAKVAFGLIGKLAVNGNVYSTSIGTMPPGQTTLRFGNLTGPGGTLNGWLRKFNYLATPSTDAQLQNMTTPDYPLYMVSAAAAFSYRRLRFDYSGKAALIQRDSDTTSIDVGFAGNDFDAAAFNAFVPTTGRTKTWYDQANSNTLLGNAGAAYPVTFSHVPEDHTRWGGFTTGGSSSYMSAADNANMQNAFAAGGYLMVVYRNENEASTGALIAKGTTAGWEINVYKNATNDWRHVWYIKGATTDGFWVTNEQVSPNVLHVVTVEYNASTPTTPPVITIDGVTCTIGTSQNPVGTVMNDTGQPLVAFNNNVTDTLNNALAGGVYEAILVKGIPSAALKSALLSNVKSYYAIP